MRRWRSVNNLRTHCGRSFGRKFHVFRLIVMVQLLPGAARAAAHAPPTVPDACKIEVKRYLARRPAMRAAEAQVIRLLDAKQYDRSVLALRSEVTRYADPWAGFALGHLYAAGLGVPRSVRSAVHWYRWAARRGNRFAQRQLAGDYVNGAGVGRDPARAAHWFRIGVAPYELGSAEYRLAKEYANATLVPVNQSKQRYYFGESLRTLRELARRPNGEAEFDLGRAYAGGYGVARNRMEALKYFCRAFSHKYEPAAGRIQELEDSHR